VNDSWESARRHPALTVMGLFWAGLLGVGAISYFAPGGHGLYAALVTGLGCGLILASVGWRGIHQDAGAVDRPLRRFTVFNVLTVAAGVVLLAWGASVGDASLALSGLPLVALGVGLTVARHVLER
jgi:hypothetical protein